MRSKKTMKLRSFAFTMLFSFIFMSIATTSLAGLVNPITIKNRTVDTFSIKYFGEDPEVFITKPATINDHGEVIITVNSDKYFKANFTLESNGGISCRYYVHRTDKLELTRESDTYGCKGFTKYVAVNAGKPVTIELNSPD